MIKMVFEFLVFQNGELAEVTKVSAKYESPLELARALVAFGAQGSEMRFHPIVRPIHIECEHILAPRVMEGFGPGTVLVIKNVREA